VAASRNAGERIVIVGGSGLYLSALLEGLAFVPQIPASVRAESQAALKAGKVGVLLRHLESTDPATFARLDLQNPMRVQRAWEVLVATGRGLRDWQDERTLPVLRPDQCIRLVLSAESEFLKIAIRDRLDKMLEDGALSECADYNACGYDAALPSARALGAAPLIAHLEGRLRLEEALTAAATATSQFAKRQRTWLRNRMADWHWVDPWARHLLTSVPRK
jgi:tRNA dimethylallyltransferase